MLEEQRAEIGGLPVADALDPAELLLGLRLARGDLVQRAVVEDEIRRHAALAREVAPQRAQALEQLRIRGEPRLVERDLRARLAARLLRFALGPREERHFALALQHLD